MSDWLLPNDPAEANRPFLGEFEGALRRVLGANRLVLGPEVAAFEAEFSAFLGGEVWTVGVASGTDAIECALRALEVRPGDGVLLPANAASGTAAGVERCGAVPVFCDVDPRTFTLCPASVARCLRHHGSALPLRALLPVHLYGQMADLRELLPLARRSGLAVIEDCAQAHGAAQDGRLAGTLGEAAAFSFYPTKNLGALGDGGAVVTSSPALRDRLRRLREYDWTERHVSGEPPRVNSRLDEVQAAFLRLKLPGLAAENEGRRRFAAELAAALPGGLRAPVTAEGNRPVYHHFTLRCGTRREALREWLASARIGSAVVYPVPLHLQPAYRGRCRCDPAGLPTAEALASEILSLPVQAGLMAEARARLTAALRSFPPTEPGSSRASEPQTEVSGSTSDRFARDTRPSGPA